jgi:hypothetical protein
MKVSPAPFGYDADGNPRTIAVLLDGAHEGLVVWHSPQEYRRLWDGVDRACASALGKPSDEKNGSAG